MVSAPNFAENFRIFPILLLKIRGMLNVGFFVMGQTRHMGFSMTMCGLTGYVCDNSQKWQCLVFAPRFRALHLIGKLSLCLVFASFSRPRFQAFSCTVASFSTRFGSNFAIKAYGQTVRGTQNRR